MNARQEVVRMLERDRKDILCAKIKYRPSTTFSDWDDSEEDLKEEEPKIREPKTLLLYVDHTQEELEEFLRDLDFRYDDGYGTQEIEGTIWCKDDTWYERQEYDGSEWWVLRERPPVPKLLQGE
jgi:hypothetical protein